MSTKPWTASGPPEVVPNVTTSPLITKEFPVGSFQVDMAQPMANAAFYHLEPQARDGLVGWGVMDDILRALGAAERPVVYPVFRMRRMVQ